MSKECLDKAEATTDKTRCSDFVGREIKSQIWGLHSPLGKGERENNGGGILFLFKDNAQLQLAQTCTIALTLANG